MIILVVYFRRVHWYRDILSRPGMKYLEKSCFTPHLCKVMNCLSMAARKSSSSTSEDVSKNRLNSQLESNLFRGKHSFAIALNTPRCIYRLFLMFLKYQRSSASYQCWVSKRNELIHDGWRVLTGLQTSWRHAVLCLFQTRLWSLVGCFLQSAGCV